MSDAKTTKQKPNLMNTACASTKKQTPQLFRENIPTKYYTYFIESCDCNSDGRNFSESAIKMSSTFTKHISQKCVI